jgi:hypothetical protein
LAAAAFALAVPVMVILTGGVSIAARAQAPSNTQKPAIFGTTQEGQTLTGNTGSWAGATPISFSFQWMRCNANNTNLCTAIAGATTASHPLTSADVGSAIRFNVTATNAEGSASALSDAAPVIVSQAAPVNTGEPTVSGTPTVGSTLTASTGSWSGATPMTFAFQWRRCPASGGQPDASDCAVIGGAASQAYVASSADVGSRLRVVVTATNASGSASRASDATAVVTVAAQAQAPVNAGQPRITGTARVGSTLAATPGIWRNDPTSFAYQWRRCPASGGRPDASDCAVIGGATSNAYTPGASDVGQRLRVRVTATNARGSATAASNATGVVQAAPPPPVATGCPAGSGPIRIDQITTPARLLVDGQQIVPPVVGSSTTTITSRFHVSACGGRPVIGALVYAAAVPFNQFTVREQPTGADGWATLTMSRLHGFPAARAQQLLVIFVRARKPGENVLSGISTRRLVSFRVHLDR